MTTLKVTCPLCGRPVEPERFEEAPHKVKVWIWESRGRGKIHMETADVDEEVIKDAIREGVKRVVEQYFGEDWY